MEKFEQLLSKIISKLNTSVKTEVQSFTEEQQKQARENIGIFQYENLLETLEPIEIVSEASFLLEEGAYYNDPSVFPNIPQDREIEVTINGITYITLSKVVNYEGLAINYLGGDFIFGGEPTPDVPFAIVLNSIVDLEDPTKIDMIGYFNTDPLEPYDGEIILSIKVLGKSKIKEQYLPQIDYNGNLLKNQPIQKVKDKVDITSVTNNQTQFIPGLITEECIGYVTYDGIDYIVPITIWPHFAIPMPTDKRIVIGQLEPSDPNLKTPFSFSFYLRYCEGGTKIQLDQKKHEDGNISHEVSISIDFFKYNWESTACSQSYNLDCDLSEVSSLDFNYLHEKLTEASIYTAMGLPVFAYIEQEEVIIKEIAYVDHSIMGFCIVCEDISQTKLYYIAIDQDSLCIYYCPKVNSYSQRENNLKLLLSDEATDINFTMLNSSLSCHKSYTDYLIELNKETIKKIKLYNGEEVDSSTIQINKIQGDLGTIVYIEDELGVLLEFNEDIKQVIKVRRPIQSIELEYVLKILPEYLPQDLAIGIPDNVPVIDFAETNEAIVVDTIDENGTPTSYKTAELSSWRIPSYSFTFDGNLTDRNIQEHTQKSVLVKISNSPIKVNKNNFKQVIVHKNNEDKIYNVLVDSTTLDKNEITLSKNTEEATFLTMMLDEMFIVIVHKNGVYINDKPQEKGIYFSCFKDSSTYISLLETKEELHQLSPIFVPSTIPNIQTAKVGQVITVKEVDNNGAPTAWETVDFNQTSEQIVLNCILIKDAENGSTYKIEMHNGNLVTYEYIPQIPCTGIELIADWGENQAQELEGSRRETMTLTAILTPENTTDKVIWSSSNESVATVENGLVTGVYNLPQDTGSATATITATCGSQTATYVVVVSDTEFPLDIM